MINRGFIDLLFILLCSTLVLLAQAIPLQGLKAAPAQAGVNGSRPLLGTDLVIVSVSDVDLATTSARGQDLGSLGLRPGEKTVVLVPATDQLPHHRIMRVWRAARDSGFHIELGVQAGGSP